MIYTVYRPGGTMSNQPYFARVVDRYLFINKWICFWSATAGNVPEH